MTVQPSDQVIDSAVQADPGVVILMYHRIAWVDRDPWGMCVSPEHFAEHLDCIKRVATPMSLLEFIRCRDTNAMPKRAVVVTFDDGYVDNFELALPILRQHQVPATVFVSTCNIDSGREFWWDRLETLLLSPGTLPDRLELSVCGVRQVWDLGLAAIYTMEQSKSDLGTFAWSASPGTRMAFYYDVWKALWPLPDDNRRDAMDQLAAWVGFDELPDVSRRTMSSDEIRIMGQDVLVEIGAHTVDHPPLPAHEARVQSDQILHCQDHLQSILGYPVTSFAYPHGQNSAETVRILQEAGFKCAVTIKQQLAGRHSEAMQLPRFGVKDLAGDAFERQLCNWFDRA